MSEILLRIAAKAALFLEKTLTSRKFWAVVVASTPSAMAGDWTTFSQMWLGYAGAVMVVDTAERFGAKRAAIERK